MTPLERARLAYLDSRVGDPPKTPADEYIARLEIELQSLKARLRTRRSGW